MTVAIIMPQKIAREDFLISISRRDAIRDPFHAPVPGSGIPTNSISPQNSYSVYSVVYQTDFQGFKKDETLSGTCYEIGRQGNEKK